MVDRPLVQLAGNSRAPLGRCLGSVRECSVCLPDGIPPSDLIPWAT